MGRNRITLDVKGTKELRQAIRDFQVKAEGAFAAALYDEALQLDRKAQGSRFCPVDTGRMRATHYVSPPMKTGRMIVTEIGYGVAYAVYVHERDDLKHPVGTDHWLKKALEERAQGMLGRLATKTERALSKGWGVEAIPATAPTKPQDPGPRPKKGGTTNEGGGDSE